MPLPVPFGFGQWQLFDLEKDPGEVTDLSNKFPDVKEGLIGEWNNYAKHNEVYDHHGHYDSFYRKSFKPDEGAD